MNYISIFFTVFLRLYNYITVKQLKTKVKKKDIVHYYLLQKEKTKKIENINQISQLLWQICVKHPSYIYHCMLHWLCSIWSLSVEITSLSQEAATRYFGFCRATHFRLDNDRTNKGNKNIKNYMRQYVWLHAYLDL